MKVSQKLLTVLLSLAMLLSFVGCGSDSAVSDSPTRVANTSADSASQITEKGSETDKQEESTTPSNKVKKVGSGTATPVKPAAVGAYTGAAYAVVNNNQPNFSAAELTASGYEKYSELDSLGRCGAALASCGKDTMPGLTKPRGVLAALNPPVGFRQNITAFQADICGIAAT